MASRPLMEGLTEANDQAEKHKTASNSGLTFEVDSYKWRLCLHPNGNKKSYGDGPISILFSIFQIECPPLGWEVNVGFKLLVYNQIHDKYLTIQDANGRVRRFHGMKTEIAFCPALSPGAFTTLFSTRSRILQGPSVRYWRAQMGSVGVSQREFIIRRQKLVYLS
ncbi:hypothetical protein NC651_023402 [Populus alba x Populus x berolinensis]|nr:hypothetical protein NC651_023402 [Populus alba x Populus x berolinensis]